MDQQNDPDSFFEKEITLMRELLSVLIEEESLLSCGEFEARTSLSKKRGFLRKKIRSLRKKAIEFELSIHLEESEFLKKQYEALETQIKLQKRRNLHLIRSQSADTCEPQMQKQPPINSAKLLTIDPADPSL